MVLECSFFKVLDVTVWHRVLQQISKGLHVVILSSGIFFFGCVFVHAQMLAQQVKCSELICKFDLVFQTVLAKALDLDGLDCGQIIPGGIQFDRSSLRVDQVAGVGKCNLGKLSNDTISRYTGPAALLSLQLGNAILNANIC